MLIEDQNPSESSQSNETSYDALTNLMWSTYGEDDETVNVSSTAEVETPTAETEPVIVVDPTPAPAYVAPPVVDEKPKLPPGVVPYEALKAEREERKRAVEAMQKMQAEFDAFRNQRQEDTVPAFETTYMDEEVPDPDTDPFGHLQYTLKLELAARDERLAQLENTYNERLNGLTHQARMVEIKNQEAETRRQLGETTYDEAIAAFYEYRDNHPEVSFDGIFKTPNPAYSAFEIGQTVLASQRAAAPAPAAFDVDALKAQIQAEYAVKEQEIYTKAKQDAYNDFAATLKQNNQPAPSMSLSNLPAASPTPAETVSALTVTKEQLASMPRNEQLKMLGDLFDYMPK